MVLASGFALKLKRPHRHLERLRHARKAIRLALEDTRAEHAGLDRRFRSNVVDAGFLGEAIADDGTTAGAERRLCGLSSSIIQTERRLVELEDQIDFLDDLDARISNYLQRKVGR